MYPCQNICRIFLWLFPPFSLIEYWQNTRVSASRSIIIIGYTCCLCLRPAVRAYRQCAVPTRHDNNIIIVFVFYSVLRIAFLCALARHGGAPCHREIKKEGKCFLNFFYCNLCCYSFFLIRHRISFVLYFIYVWARIAMYHAMVVCILSSRISVLDTYLL